MANDFERLSPSQRWNTLVGAAKRGLLEAGYKIHRRPGRGLSNIWTIEKGERKETAAIRTTRDRWFAFPPLDGGKKFKTLDDIDQVIVATVDKQHGPQFIDVFIFPAGEVRKRFVASYAARREAGHVLRDNFGLWVSLYVDTRGTPAGVGSGIADEFPRIARYSISELISQEGNKTSGEDDAREAEPQEASRPQSIAEVMAWAREQVAQIAGVRIEAVKLDLKVEY